MGVADDQLRQADLSQMRLQEMTSDERAELRRRYETFVKHFGPTGGPKPRFPAASKGKLRKWVPGARH